MTGQLKEEALALAPRLQEIFRALHRRPELGNQERHTAGLIRSRARVEAGERVKPVNMARRIVMASARLAARKTTKPTHTASRV